MRNAFRRDLNFSSTQNNELVTNCDRFNKLKHSNALPYVFKEQGIAMFSDVLPGKNAIKTSLSIVIFICRLAAIHSSQRDLLHRTSF